MQPNEYHVFVIGGGSGGLACAKEAAKLGAKVGIADFVKPSPQGTTWGLGGTCVNVGCIPKKLMHYSALLGESIADLAACGWNAPKDPVHSWKEMIQKVNEHIFSLNWGYKQQLKSKNVDYYNELASFVDDHTIQLKSSKGETHIVKAKSIVIAVGGRPNYEAIPGAEECCITSDDLFWLKDPPKGKILVVGGSYVALECAGFLHALRMDVTLMVRSIFLRGFDQDMAERVGSHMLAHNLKIQRGVAPSKMEKTKDGRINVYYKTPDGKDACDVYDTVLLAIGRKAVTEDLNLGNIGIKPHPNGKIDVDEFEQTSVKGVYAIGDVIFGKPELTPVAIKTGILLAKRLGHTSDRQMDYNLIPTSVFTPLEYGFVGYAEEDAIKKFTKEKITVYHTSFQPLEWSMYEGHEKDVCYAKVIVNNENDKVLGIHITSPNAGEVVQGLAVAMNCGLTKEQLDMTVGIHPTIAEEIVGLLETKDSNPDAKKKGC